MKLTRNATGPGWRATQGIRWGEGETRLAAVLDCMIACAEALSLGVRRGARELRDELYWWWREVFVAGDE